MPRGQYDRSKATGHIGRPKKTEGLLMKKITFRLSAEEKRYLTEKAHAEGKKVSLYIRDKMLKEG